MIWLPMGAACCLGAYVTAAAQRKLNRRRRLALAAMMTLSVLGYVLPGPWSVAAAVAYFAAWAVFLTDDDHWPRLRRRVRVALKRASALAWGVPARRPQPA